LTASFSVPSPFAISTTPGWILGCFGTVRVRRARKAARRVAGSSGSFPSTMAGLQTETGFVTSRRTADANRSATSVPRRGTNAGKNGARTAAPL
jgi:hypothetical protein